MKPALAVFEQPVSGAQPHPAAILGIFQKHKRAVAYETLSGGVMMPYDWATGIDQLRRRVFARDDYRCVKCLRTVTWDSGHMHEKLHRGRGGDRTINNCETLCREHHVGPRGEHP